jgi:hypothetical protein
MALAAPQQFSNAGRAVNPASISPEMIWVGVTFTLACMIAIIVGLNFALGTRRRLGMFFIWIPTALLIAAGSAVAIVLAHG